MVAPKHILVIRLSAMGDVAMTIPVLRAFRQQHPEVKITAVSHQFFKPLFDTIPDVNFYGVDLGNRHKGFDGIFKIFTDLKKLNVDVVADLHNVLRSKIIRNLFRLWGKKVAHTDKGRDGKKALTRPFNKDFKQLETMFQRHADTFAELGYPIDLSQIDFPAIQPLSAHVKQVVGSKQGKWLGIAPYAQYDSKIYPEDLMKEVIKGIAAKQDVTVFLFGSKSEKSKLEVLQQGFGNVKIIPGTMSFQEELLLIGHLDVLMSMDSGNAHIAAMFGVKVVTLWGATHPYAGFMPFNQPMENAILSDREKYPQLPTSVYGNKDVPECADAMRTIKPKEVIKKLSKLLLLEKVTHDNYTSS
ncbi:glycosyltransferase family 9 protein [Neptunitalea lumnitzerae]|uniref:Heptosyltransferase n=1 Tax=Neptunitalea lumnitzerae TaxID=2965509 RepID=A0ABQ5MFG4_9FLAO|nr:glycosyltransferase family 9 protein [Neptunitalea sp. Y10]GLB48123.1 heptosyltransferase [Neptunitalea sp. Y10]